MFHSFVLNMRKWKRCFPNVGRFTRDSKMNLGTQERKANTHNTPQSLSLHKEKLKQQDDTLIQLIHIHKKKDKGVDLSKNPKIPQWNIF